MEAIGVLCELMSVALMGLSFPTSVLLEKIALALGPWDYRPAIPILRLGA